MAPGRSPRSRSFRAALLAAAALSGGGLAWVQERPAGGPGRAWPAGAEVRTTLALTAAPSDFPLARADRPVDAVAEPRALAQEPLEPEGLAGSPGRSASSPCPEDMVAVRGEYCDDAQQVCLEWANDDRHRCLRFRQPSTCRGARRRMDLCVDRYEWPNRAGARPAVMATWFEAQRACRAAGKRLCTMDEWTFACEGEEMRPYPYGYEREPGACTTDHRARAPIRRLLNSLSRAVSLAEAGRVYEAAPSGSAPGCASPFGAMDMAGNVDEWTVNPAGVPHHSALKGGWWGRVRSRCRPSTLGHYESFRYYNIGFRCCAPARP